LLILARAEARAQDHPPPLRLSGVVPGGVRASATEARGTFDFTLDNFADTDRRARVLLFYTGRPDVQYGRDVWVPAHSSLSTWMLAGPAPEQNPLPGTREIQVLLYDDAGGKGDLVLPPGEERVRSRGILYHKREPATTILLDDYLPPDRGWGRLPRPPSANDEAFDLARTFRAVRNLSERLERVNPGFLPATPEAFDGVDHFILASERIARDPAALQALRRWVEGGGRLWVMLDRVEPDVLAALLGDALDFQVVDRVSLTNFRIQTGPAGPRGGFAPSQEHERPVEFVRVLLPDGEKVRDTVNGWPAWFVRPLGRGKVVFTTLGPRAWYRPRTPRDPGSPYATFPFLPVPNDTLLVMGYELHAPEDSLPAEAFRASLAEEIGYSVVDRRTVALVFGAFLLAALAAGLALRRSRRPELLGWLGPAAAVGATAAFLAVGVSSRRAAMPTVATAQVVDAVSGTGEAAVHGLLAVYRPDSGPAEVGAARGGFFDLDMAGIEGKTRRLVLTDLDAWHWEGLELPAGVRFAPFHSTTPTGAPIRAGARFGPRGLEGKLAAGPFEELADGLLTAPAGRHLSPHLEADGAFTAAGPDVLPAGQFLPGAVLTDRQQRRQELYRAFLAHPGTGPLEGRYVFLAWARAADLHFTLAPDARLVGSAVLVVPLQLVRTPPGTQVVIPGPFVGLERVLPGTRTRPTLDSPREIDMHLRFQVPPTVLPLAVERARLSARIEAPARRVTIAGRAGEEWREVHRVDSPLDPIRVEVTDERLLRPDAEGGLHVRLEISEPLQGGDARGGARGEEKWSIKYLELEVSGRTLPAP
jgi:hypothetical protein